MNFDNQQSLLSVHVNYTLLCLSHITVFIFREVIFETFLLTHMLLLPKKQQGNFDNFLTQAYFQKYSKMWLDNKGCPARGSRASEIL